MIGWFKRIGAWLVSRKVELGLGVRVTVAAMGALVIALACGLKLPLWAVLTSLIVTQMSVGRSLKATRDYLIGTVGGAIYGGAIAILIPHNGEGALLAVLVMAVAPLAFIAAINPSLNVATVTAIIVLLLPTMNHGNPLDSAIDRVLEVAVGAITGLAVSFLVLPSRAHSQIRRNGARVIELLAAVLNELLSGLTRGRDNDTLHALQDGSGKTISDQTLKGRPFLVYFGYTHCPDVCPTELARISDILGKMGDKAIPTLFITVDPERDTPKLMQDYVSSFNPAVIGLSGSQQAVKATEKTFRVYARKGQPQPDGDYSMDHSSIVYLMDKNGAFVEAFNVERSPDDAAKDLEKYL